ncbi:hypothetical protein PVAP13_2NG481606 [Panicum virgatum]|uniref:FBD domain-containing protein n=1 Tax=Panicum virgatum TaxID=38727 RepID=A0A8T0VL17_PANVG|nr:hypothetical protein PVAP13_2NG481606 [Panicum virgatum]
MVPVQQSPTRKPKIQKNRSLSLCLRLAPVPLASCPPQCASDPRLSAIGPPPVPRPASGSSSPTSRPPHLGNGNSASGRPQLPRRPSANAPAPARRRPPLPQIPGSATGSLELKTPEHLEHTLVTNSRENTRSQPQHCSHGDILSLDIAAADDLGDVAWTFEKEISRIPVRNLSVLELKIATRGHFYGAMVLDLLRLCTSIQKLKVRKECSVNYCNCDLPNNWKDQIISLTALKEVEIDGYEGEEHEVGLLKVLLICAEMLERVTISLSRNVPRSCSAYLELPGILKAHPSVKFNIYHWCGDQVLFE